MGLFDSSQGKGMPSGYGARKTRQASGNRPSNWQQKPSGGGCAFLFLTLAGGTLMVLAALGCAAAQVVT